MALDREFWSEYVMSLDQRISSMVTLRDKIRALLEVSDLLSEEAIEAAVLGLKDRVDASASEVSAIEAEVTTKLRAPENLR